MIEIKSPLIAELVAKTRQDTIVRVLKARFGKVPTDVIKHLRSVVKEKKLNQLVKYSAVCPSMDAFREYLLS